MAGIISSNNKGYVGSFLQERRKAMEGCRFRPENYHEISRVLGNGYAPDLNRVTSKHRAGAASAYLRRLRRDVERSQGGYYNQLQAMPLQIKRLPVRKEDPRSFKSLLIPKLKLSPLPAVASTPSPRTVKESHSPKMESPGGRGEVPPHVVPNGSGYVPHKYFSPHSHTHIHVLFKQMPGQTTHRKGASSIVSSEISGGGGGSSGSSSISIFTDSGSKAAFKSKQNSFKNNSKLPSPREVPSSSLQEDEEGDSAAAWPADDLPRPYSLPKFPANLSPMPTHFKKRVAAAADKTARAVDKSPRGTVHNSHSRSVFRSPRIEHQPGQVPAARKSGESSPVNQFSSSKDVPVVPEALPPNVAAALAAGSSLSALYNLDLPHELATAYDKNLPTMAMERPKAMVMGGAGGNKGSPRLLPSIPANVTVENEMLAITSVKLSNAIHLAAV